MSYEEIADEWYFACAQAQYRIEQLCAAIAALPPTPPR